MEAQPPEVRDLLEPGRREREAARKKALMDFYTSLPERPSGPIQTEQKGQP